MTNTRGFKNVIWVWSPYNYWNTENDYKAIKDTYAHSRVLTGGAQAPDGTANYNWWNVH